MCAEGGVVWVGPHRRRLHARKVFTTAGDGSMPISAIISFVGVCPSFPHRTIAMKNSPVQLLCRTAHPDPAGGGGGQGMGSLLMPHHPTMQVM